MSVAVDWAIGRKDLDGFVRLVLIYCARWVNREGVIFHSYRKIARELGFSPRFVFNALRQLSGQTEDKRTELTLITDPAERVALLLKSKGRPNCRAALYRVNCTAHDAAHRAPSDDAHRAPSKPRDAAHRAPSNGAPHAPSPKPNGASGAPMMVHTVQRDDAHRAPEVLNEVKKAEVRGARERARGADAPEQGQISDSGKKEGSKEGAAALPVPPAPTPEPAGGQAPMIGQPLAEGGKPPGDPFAEGGGDTAGTPPTRGSYLAALQRRHGGSRTLHCEIEGEVLQGAVLEPEPEPVGPKATMGLVRSVGRDMRHFALAGVGPVRTVEQQLAIVSPLHAQNPVRTVAQQYAEVLGISLAEAEARLGAIGAATEAAPA